MTQVVLSTHITFTEAKKAFDDKYLINLHLENTFVPVGKEYKAHISLKNTKGEPSEEYYKWQFIYALINSGLYSKDYIGVELHFPKGSVGTTPIKIDSCIFDNKDWRGYYRKWIDEKDFDSIDWLRNHLIVVIEFKKADGKAIKQIFSSQIKAYFKESEKQYCLALYYDKERLYIFQRKYGKILRYDESKNRKGNNSNTNELSLDLPDGYNYIPSFQGIIDKINIPKEIDRSKRTVDDLDLITGVHSSQINIALSNILTKMDKVSMVNQRGYEILIQMLALKIFDEKRSEKYKQYLKFYQTQMEQERLKLLFYIQPEEKEYVRLSDKSIRSFIDRIRTLYNDASIEYKIILKATDTETINWKNANHVKVISAIVENLQDYSFIKSSQTDLYQLVFYQFANAFTKIEKGQFVTPLKLIDFLVKIVNPRNGEYIVDPTVGIADFLSLSYVNSNMTLDDRNIYGAENDEQMIMLAKLNMLLNGDGNAVLKYKPDYGSLLYKFDTDKEMIPLDTKQHKNGNWDTWANQTKLMKFNVVLTNPPFGENRKFKPKTKVEQEIAELYEIWDEARIGTWIDPGLLFLENAYRILDINGRMGIILSNSLASIERWEKARMWLRKKMRIVALFDLPPNVFADTGVNTTLVVAYKPTEKELEQLKKDKYEIFIRDVKNVGYEIRTLNRVKSYKPLYKIDEATFEVCINEDGQPMLDEDFTHIIKAFKQWVTTQEETLKNLFID